MSYIDKVNRLFYLAKGEKRPVIINAKSFHEPNVSNIFWNEAFRGHQEAIKDNLEVKEYMSSLMNLLQI